MVFGFPPTTSSSPAQSRGTSPSPSSLAARAGKALRRSLVEVKIDIQLVVLDVVALEQVGEQLAGAGHHLPGRVRVDRGSPQGDQALFRPLLTYRLASAAIDSSTKRYADES